MGWYDKAENNTGALCARLSADAAKIQVNHTLGIITEAACNMCVVCTVQLYSEHCALCK